MSRRLLAVDLSNQIYRAAHAHSMLQSDGLFTGGLFGFIQTVAAAIEKSGATDLLVCRDEKPYRRSLIYPDYKKLRKSAQDPELKERYDASLPLIEDFLDILDIPYWGRPGFECDDLIGYCSRRLLSPMRRACFEAVVGMSNDSDLFQLFDLPGFRIYKDAKQPLLTRETTLGRNSINGEDFILCSALQGTHNEIAGILGIGPVNALKIIKDAAKLRKYRGEHGALIDRNIELIRLPHPEFGQPEIPFKRRRTGLNPRTLYKFCARFDIDPQSNWVKAFDQVL